MGDPEHFGPGCAGGEVVVWKAVLVIGLGASEPLPGFLRGAAAGGADTHPLLLCQPGGGFAAETERKQPLLVSHLGEQQRPRKEPQKG